MRVLQLDANLLDGELDSMMKEHLLDSLKLFKSKIRERYEPEIGAFLRLILYSLPVYVNDATYGSQLQNLQYVRSAWWIASKSDSAILERPPAKWQKGLHGLVHVGGWWCWTRLNVHATRKGWSELPENDSRHRVWMLLQKAETCYRAVSLLNLLVFLVKGRYRSIWDRLLGMRLMYARRETTRQVSYDFMNRQLVWNAFTEFLLFLVPLVNLNRIQSQLQTMLSFGTGSKSRLSLPPNMCAICHRDDVSPAIAHTPYETNCGHVYCYYCIRTALLQDPSFACLQCGQQIESIQQVVK
ncbi:Pex12 amino terminal region-domain-containing protein [Cladochytrium replicatum]|nr:Pex12 amino terminal region-domain-containing protein [Cladochytrium replicatum]